MDFETLFKIALSKLNPRDLTDRASAGFVAAALLTDKGNVFTGVNIDAPCSVGFCAEHGAIAAMVNAGEDRIVKMVAVEAENRKPLPPCGRCREFICQVNDENYSCEVMLDGEITTIADLLPHRWNEKWL